MKTSKPFSTISYNSVDFLIVKLDELIERNILSFYSFVGHFPEKDESKKHIHLFLIPNGTFQTDTLKPFLSEIDSNNLKPLTIMPCQSSKFGDWYLYACHDSAYLATKGQSRQFHYTKDDFCCSNFDYFLELIHTIDFTKYRKATNFIEKAKNGSSFRSLVESGEVPIVQIKQYETLYNLVSCDSFNRADRTTHTPLDDSSDLDGLE